MVTRLKAWWRKLKISCQNRWVTKHIVVSRPRHGASRDSNLLGAVSSFTWWEYVRACVRVCVRPGRNWHVSTHISTHIKTPCCRQKQCVCASLMTALCSEWIRQRLWVTIHSLPGVMGLVTRPVLSGFYAYTYTCRIEIYRYPNTGDVHSEQHSFIPTHHILKLGQDRFGVTFWCSRYPFSIHFSMWGPFVVLNRKQLASICWCDTGNFSL